MPNTNITPDEADFLRAVARTENHPQIIRHLVQQIEDFGRLFDLARNHGVLSLLHSHLVESDISLPSGYMTQLQDEYCTNVAQNLAAAAELLTLLAIFEKNGIPALPFKGVTLANAIYGKVGLRPAGDLDVLIDGTDLSRAARLVIAQGYQLKTSVQADGHPAASHVFEYHFERFSDGMIVELRWRLNEWYLQVDLGMDWLWPQRQCANLLGRPMTVMSPEHTLILLCMHASKHGWSRLIWLCDIAQLLVSNPNLDWRKAVRDANRFGLSKTLELGVLLAMDVLGAPAPESASLCLRRRSATMKLARYISENFFDEIKRLPTGRVPYHVRLLGFRDRVRWWWLVRPFRPNEQDRLLIRIPKPLDFLYYLVRPLRLVRDSWRRHS